MDGSSQCIFLLRDFGSSDPRLPWLLSEAFRDFFLNFWFWNNFRLWKVTKLVQWDYFVNNLQITLVICIYNCILPYFPSWQKQSMTADWLKIKQKTKKQREPVERVTFLVQCFSKYISQKSLLRFFPCMSPLPWPNKGGRCCIFYEPPWKSTMSFPF